MAGYRIGIAGAGIGGLAAAAALAADGHAVTVYDQFDAPEPVGSGLVIQPVGQAVLAALGLERPAREHGTPIRRPLGHAAGVSRPVLDVAYDPTGARRRDGLGIHRAALFQVLFDAAAGAGAALRPGHAVTGVTDDPRRQLTFRDREASPPFDLVVDASGAGSPLSPLRARRLPFGAIWGTVNWPTDTVLAQDRLSQRYRAASRMAGVLPVGRVPGNSQCKAAVFWSLTPDSLARWRDASLQDWKDEAEALWPAFAPFLAQVTDHDQMIPAFYSHGTLRNPVARGLVHIGDAAHRASPQLGQGANMALLDAWALCRALRGGGDLADALARYHRTRRLHLWVYQIISAVFTPLYQSDKRLPPFLRDYVFAPLSRVPPMPRLLGQLVSGDLVAPIHGADLQRAAEARMSGI